MYALENTVRDYAWGSTTVLPDLLGRPADGGPQAELWIGAHPDAPSGLAGADGPPSTLAELIASDPRAALGEQVAAELGPSLPFLLKVLAVEQPLSLQAHPSRAQARAGFDAEERAGIAPDAPERTYGDDNHKPEMLYAVTDFDALCGFRPVADTVRLLRALDVPALRADVEELAAADDDAAGDLAGLVRRWLTIDEAKRSGVVAEVASACQRVTAAGNELADVAATIAGLAALHPDDGGVLVALLLNRVRLRPGEAVFLPAGNLHAYLHGMGIELMASSDNVLRGGLTPKHVDVAGLLAILDAEPGPAALVRPVPSAHGEAYRVPVPDFELAVLRPRAGRAYDLPTGYPQLLLTLDGAAELSQGGVSSPLRQGRSVFISAAEPPVRVEGDAVVIRATVGAQLAEGPVGGAN